MVSLLALIGFWPSPVDKPLRGLIARALRKLHAHGVPGWVDYAFVERIANVALFVPLGAVAVLAFPWQKWWQIATLGALVSGCMELGQWMFLSQRYPSLADLALNTAGAAIGALIARRLVPDETATL
ncbi:MULTISPECIES: VanZ family protein [Arthrobacter]|uniref:VanZ family protein n=1 Tax=Arthrobacter oryzae TaxID=409290 RepID=A0A3N0BL72_9MICC|nr:MULTISPECIES: VanZ family protein [Arthrobacter]QYF89339.1 VanZ family protein [Arthrobacter sp. PAMC25284]RNL49200.1 VanZ family protein [Arthrobacter oryzae]